MLTTAAGVDSNAPSWTNLLNGQINLRDAIRRKIDFEQGGKPYKLSQSPATLLVRFVLLQPVLLRRISLRHSAHEGGIWMSRV